jgi:hypothetical protein
MEPLEGAIRGEGEDNEVAMVGHFEWIRHPEVPEPAAPRRPPAG